jgi:N-acetylmuramoyl-L-alanine amidase CwlA
MLPITRLLLDNYNRPLQKLKQVKGIVIHWTANTSKGADAKANRNYFNTKPRIVNRKGETIYASAHYVIDDKSIIQCVPDDEVAFHVGAKWELYREDAHKIMGQPRPNTDSPNNYLIGIEMCVNEGGVFEKTRNHTIDLTQYLLKKHHLRISDVYRHFDITGKDCPKMFLETAKWARFISDLKNNHFFEARGIVNSKDLNVRKGAGTNFPILRKLQEGEEVPILDQNGLWFKIAKDEWVHAHYIRRF